MDISYQPRWPFVLRWAVPWALLLGTIVFLSGSATLLILSSSMGSTVLVLTSCWVAAVGLWQGIRKLRRQRLTITDSGLTHDVGPYVVHVRWEDFEGLKKTRLLLPMVEVLSFHTGQVEAGAGPMAGKYAAAAWRKGANRTVRVSPYFKDWRDSPIPQALTARGIEVPAAAS